MWPVAGTTGYEFARLVETSGVVEDVPVSTPVWIRSLSLEWDHRDPATG